MGVLLISTIFLDKKSESLHSVNLIDLADNSMKKAYIAIFSVLIAVGAFALWEGSRPTAPETVKHIGVLQFVTHPALEEVYESMKEQLKARGYVEGENLEIVMRNAQGDMNIVSAIAQDLSARDLDVLIPITTPSALAMAKVAPNATIVFTGVSYPREVGLVDDVAHPGGNISGVSDQWPFEEQIRSYLQIAPQTKRIGMLYKPGDDTAKRGLDAVMREAKGGSFQLVARPISQASDVYASAVDLFRDVDVIYTGIDLTVAENLDALLKASLEGNKPILGGDSGSVEKGAVMALSVSMHDIGRLTGDMVADVLEGERIGEIPVRFVRDGALLLNEERARAFGFNIDAIRARYPDAEWYTGRGK